MTMNDPLASVLASMYNYEKIGKSELFTEENSKIIRKVLEIMQEERMIEGFEEIKNSKGNSLKIKLIGLINKCGVIKPRFRVKMSQYEKFEKSYLPARDFGVIIVSTNKGLMTHKKAKEQNLGGTLISFAY